ncbi:MAG: DNA repair protein RecN, partial [Bacteroidales bacterium]|nr:DNA repair protein RecN [Bacteroidales bacterium]
LEGDEYGVMNTLSSLLKDLKRAAAHHNALAADLPRWESLLIELDDLRKDLEPWSVEVESDPRKKLGYEERLDAIYRLEKKHGVEDVQDLIDLQNKLQGQLNLSENAEEEISRLEEAVRKETEALTLLSSRLTAARKASAQTLREAILASLAELGMEQARLEIAFTPLESFGNEGCDRVAFLFSANLGAPLQEMAKVASGGELSRVMLAVKSVIHQGSLLGTLILDEIDTGVSGKIAAKVARMMKNLSRYMQVVAITHLPQIAAAADVHYRVYKTLENGAAVSNMSRLSAQEHIESVASMLSNGPVTPVALQAARELVEG